MKLTQAKLTGTLKKLADGKTVYRARKVAKISIRRVYQVKEAFDKTVDTILLIGGLINKKLKGVREGRCRIYPNGASLTLEEE